MLKHARELFGEVGCGDPACIYGYAGRPRIGDGCRCIKGSDSKLHAIRVSILCWEIASSLLAINGD
jgi:hypothetical protein